MTSTDDVIRAFSADHVVSLTGLSKGQLRYWDRTGFFKPRFLAENPRNPYNRIYSFKDVVGLKTLGILRKRYGIPLQQLRKVAERLAQYGDPWARLVLYVDRKEIHFKEPESQRVRGVLSGQFSSLPLESIIHEVKAESAKLKERNVAQFGCVVRHRYVMHNARVIAGTRIPTRTIWRFHEAGYSVADILREYPMLTDKDVRAAIQSEQNAAKAA
jgi:uncharacterized protein (DUF433 family)